MTGIQRNVRDADIALGNHRSTLETFQTGVRAARRNLDRPIQTVAWGITLLLIWIGLSQLAIVRWGIGLWQQDTTRRDDAQEEGRTQTDRMT